MTGNLQLDTATEFESVSINDMNLIRGGSSEFKVFSNPGDPGRYLLDINGTFYFNTPQRGLQKASDFYQSFLQPVVAAGGNSQWKEIV